MSSTVNSTATTRTPPRSARNASCCTGGLVTKVNHSCDPNCGIRLNFSGAHNFVAREPIVAGQEITFDYAMRNYTVEHFPAHCQCGSRHCRDHITGWKDLPGQRKADYRGFVAPYLPDIDNQCATMHHTSQQKG